MKVFISQSNYLPWRGFFDAINSADVYVVYDSMQYTKNDWRNRNRIKGRNGCGWLTVPVRHQNSRQRIDEVTVAREDWAGRHWQTLHHTYARAPAFSFFSGRLKSLYQGRLASKMRLTDINLTLLVEVLHWLGSNTRVVRDVEVLDETVLRQLDASRRLLRICRALGADTYLSAPAAKCYLDVGLFNGNGVSVEWVDYEGYPEYPQLSCPFDAATSIVDLLFNLGEQADTALKTF